VARFRDHESRRCRAGASRVRSDSGFPVPEQHRASVRLDFDIVLAILSQVSGHWPRIIRSGLPFLRTWGWKYGLPETSTATQEPLQDARAWIRCKDDRSRFHDRSNGARRIRNRDRGCDHEAVRLDDRHAFALRTRDHVLRGRRQRPLLPHCHRSAWSRSSSSPFRPFPLSSSQVSSWHEYGINSA